MKKCVNLVNGKCKYNLGKCKRCSFYSKSNEINSDENKKVYLIGFNYQGLTPQSSVESNSFGCTVNEYMDAIGSLIILSNKIGI